MVTVKGQDGALLEGLLHRRHFDAEATHLHTVVGACGQGCVPVSSTVDKKNDTPRREGGGLANPIN